MNGDDRSARPQASGQGMLPLTARPQPVRDASRPERGREPADDAELQGEADQPSARTSDREEGRSGQQGGGERAREAVPQCLTVSGRHGRRIADGTMLPCPGLPRSAIRRPWSEVR